MSSPTLLHGLAGSYCEREHAWHEVLVESAWHEVLAGSAWHKVLVERAWHEVLADQVPRYSRPDNAEILGFQDRVASVKSLHWVCRHGGSQRLLFP